MRPPIYNDSLLYCVYFAPRGKVRMLNMGQQLAARHLKPEDQLIGIIGTAGSGKSILVRGMFPGLELSNDDQGVNVRPLPLLGFEEQNFYSAHTYHIDVRFEMAFTSLSDLANVTLRAIQAGKRVVVEHFDLLYPALGVNAGLLIGVGEEILLTRPGVFGPLPADVASVVFKSQHYRKMAHTAENLTERHLAAKWGVSRYAHGDVRHGFILEFIEKPDVDLVELEGMVKESIQEDIPVSYCDEGHIYFGESLHPCTGPRIHVRSTKEIVNFALLPEFIQDPMTGLYMLVGLVGEQHNHTDLSDLNHLGLL